MQKKRGRRKPDKALLAGVTKEMAQPRLTSSVKEKTSRPTPPSADETLGTKRLNGNAPHFAYLADIRGIYNRIARQLGVDPSFVSRVARGQRRSKAVLDALEQEMSNLRRQLNIPSR